MNWRARRGVRGNGPLFGCLVVALIWGALACDSGKAPEPASAQPPAAAADGAAPQADGAAPQADAQKAANVAADGAAPQADANKAADGATPQADAQKALEATPEATPTEPAAEAAKEAPAINLEPVGQATTDTELVFAKKAPAVGFTTVEATRSTMDMTMKMTMMGQAKELASVELTAEERVVEVLEAKDNAITRIKVTYNQKRREGSENGAAKRATDAPVTGKTYQVTFKDGAVEVTDGEGKPADEREADIVKGDYRTLGQPDQLSKLIPDGAMKLGQTIEISDDAIKAMMNVGDEPMTFDSFTFKLKGVREIEGQKAGVFDMALNMSVKPGPGMSLGMKMTGEVVVLADGQLADFRMKGPVKVELDNALQGQMQAEGGGNVEFIKKITVKK